MIARDDESLYSQGYAFYQSGLYDRASEIFQILCAKKPLDVRFWLGLGASLQESLHYEEALPAWAMAALLDSKSPYPHFHAAQCCLSLKKRDDAAIALQNASERIQDPNHPLLGAIEVLRGEHA